MRNLLQMICAAGLLAGVLISGGCGGGSGGSSQNSSTVNVTGAGSVSAAAVYMTYTFQPGSYTYNISDFAAGDKLVFPAGTNPTVDNPDWSDGVVTVQWAGSGNVIVVNLTGLTTTQDSSLNSIDKLILQFGEGTIQ